MNEQTYFTPREAAAYLRMSPSTLAKLRVYGGGPRFSRLGRAVRYCRTELDLYCTSKAVGSTAEGETRPSLKGEVL